MNSENLILIISIQITYISLKTTNITDIQKDCWRTKKKKEEKEERD